jgi:hypothetical protein
VKPSILGIVLAATLLLAPAAHAQTGFVPIGDPETDTLQLWSGIAASIELIARDVASAAAHAASAVQHLASAEKAPPAGPNGTRIRTPKQSSALAQTASAVVATLPETATTSESEQSNSTAPQQPQSRSQPSTYATGIDFLPAPAANTSAFVTEDQFNTRLSALDNSLRQFIAATTFSASASPPIGGGAPNTIAAASNIGQLNGVTITNANLTASEIPALDYLSLSGGTLTGNLSVPTLSASSTNYGVITSTNASSTLLSNVGTAYFGGTATSSFDSAGDLIVAGSLTANGATTFANATSTNFFATTASSTNLFATAASIGSLSLLSPLAVSSGGTGANTFGQGWIYSNGSNGALAASTSPTVNYITATSTTATSTFAGNVSVAGNLNFNGTILKNGSPFIGSQWTTTGSTVSYTGGSVVIGTTTANHEFDVWSTNNSPIGLTTGDPTLTVTNAGSSLGNGSSVAFQGVDTAGSEITLGRISDISTSLTAGSASGNLAFFTRNAGTQQQDMTILAGGDVGIGTSTPSVPLEISDIAATSTAIIGSNIVSDGTFTSNPSGTWTLGTGWSWDSINGRASYTGAGGPISSISIDSGGTGYSNGDTITISGGTGDATYSATVSSGVVTALTQISPGTTYSASGSNTVATTGGTGSGLTVSILLIANAATLTQALAPSGPADSYYSTSYDSWISGTTYQVSFTIANYSGSGQVQVGIGTVSNVTQLPYYYHQGGNFTITLTSSAPTITFTPTADFVGEITNVSVAPITPSPATLRITDTTGDSSFEIRAGRSQYNGSGIAPGMNTYLGVDSGRNSTNNVGGYNVAVGYDSLFSSISSEENVAIGVAALYAASNGSKNVAIGESALQYDTTGGHNVGIGYVALGGNTTASYNTALGDSALNGNTTGGSNVAIGASALQNNNTGGNNTGLGNAALYQNVVGNQNTAVGWNALYSNTTASGNSAVGYQALSGNTTGTSNNAFGLSALRGNTTGGSNVALGTQALSNNTTGSNNIGIGFRSLLNATTSNSNVVIGFEAMQGGTTGSLTISGTNDVALGFEALNKYIDGSNNTALGYEAMLNATTSGNNAAVGYLAGRGSSTNDSYTGLAALGYQTGLNLANGSSYNTLIGYQAGNGITTGSNNIWLGTATSSTGIANLTTGSQNILIGNNISLPSATNNGQLDIGNILYGTGITSTGSTLSSGALGVATTSPWRTFSVNGTVGLAGLTSDSADSKVLCLTSNNEVVANAGTSCITSSQRFKNTIEPLDASSGLDEVMQLNPVSFYYNDNIGIPGQQVGFIAEQMQQIDPRLVVLDASNTPFTVRYENLTAILAKAIQEMATITGAFEQNLIAWLGNATNGIGDLFANNIHAQNELCVGSTCVTPAQFEAMAAAANASQSSGQGGGGSSAGASRPDTPPVIQINGDNPAVIQVGATYNDLGATIISPQADLNLGIQTYLSGTLTSNIVIDTSQVATDTVDYVVTDQNGLTSTSTRTVLVEPAAAPSIVPGDSASSTAATTTSS